MNSLRENKKTPRFCKLNQLCKLLIIIVCTSYISHVNAQDVIFKERSTITNEGLYFWYPNARNGDEVKAFHYAPNISPRGDCFTVVNGYIFFGWYKGGMKDRDLMISRKKIGSGSWVTVQLPHKNTLIGPRVNSWGDSHNTISVAVSKTDGTVHVFYDHHNDPLKYIVSKPGTAFGSDRDFNINNFESTRGYLAEGQDVTITYPQLTENEDGDIILNYRKGSAVGGNEMVHVYNSKNGTWSRAKMVLRGSGRPHVDPNNRNYAYGSAPVLAGGNIYYGFSVRWARKKDDGVLNEGVYLANCGPTMTSNFIGVDVEDASNGVNYQLPVQDYSPFLAASPVSKNGTGSSGSPSIAVSDRGDVHLGFRSRTKDTDYHYTYIRKAGENDFVEYPGQSKTGIAFGDRIYHTAINKGNGIITIQSTEAGTFNYRNELVYESGEVLGNAVVRLVDGNLVVVVESREDKNTDKQDIFSFVFQIGEDTTTPEEPEVNTDDLTGAWYKIKNLETGRYLRAIGGDAIIAASVNSGVDKEWEFIKVGNYYNIDSKTSGDGNGILRATNNTIIGTKRSAPLEDRDKVWTINPVSSPKGSFRIELKDSERYLYNETSNGNKDISLNTKVGDRSKWLLERTSSAKQARISEKLNTETLVTIFPNPTNNKFNIKVKGNDLLNVKIISMLGKVIYSNTITNGSIELSKTNGFESGLYIIQVSGDTIDTFTKKLFVN